jgi:hypothetical protein
MLLVESLKKSKALQVCFLAEKVNIQTIFFKNIEMVTY